MANYPVNLKNGGAYVDIETVKGMFKNIESYSKLDTKEFDVRIVEAATELDATLGVLYAIPISGGTTTMNFMKLLNARLAAAMIYDIFFASSAPNESPAAQSYRNFVEMMELDLVQGNIQLFDAPTNQEKPMYPKGHGAHSADEHDVVMGRGLSNVTVTEQAPIFRRTGTRHQAPRIGDLM